MKRSRKRDPSTEPYASSMSEGQRKELIRRIRDRDATDEDAKDFVRDEIRATTKVFAAKDQIAAPDDQRKRLFSDPGANEWSAMSTVGVYSDLKGELVEAGASARRAHKKAGLGRHSEFNDSATAARYARRRAAWNAIDAESRAEGKCRLRGRPLANAIAARTEEPFDTIRTWIKLEQKSREARANTAPTIKAGDWSQLMD